MVEINHQERYIRSKILYYGPAAGGKTTNIKVLHRRAKKEKKLDLFSVNSAQNRTILFDLLPLTPSAFRGYNVRFQVVGAPGQKLYAATRKMLLKTTDSVVFVANSAADRWEENLECYQEMAKYLLECDIDPSSIPMVCQYNKQDLTETTDISLMERVLNARGAESFPAVASKEKGVLETFASILSTTMSELAARYKITSGDKDAYSSGEWAEHTMLQIFGVTKSADQSEYEAEESAESGSSEPHSKVVRVKTPSKRSPGTSSATTGSAAAVRDSAPRADAPTTGAVPPIEDVSTAGVSAADEVQDAASAIAMMESYAEAAVGLADHISDLREQRDSESRRAVDFSAVADSVDDLLKDAGAGAPDILQELLKKLAANWEASYASLSILKPEGKLEQMVRHGLELDPMDVSDASEGRPVGTLIVEAGKRVTQMRGDQTLLDEAIRRVGLDCVAAAAFPLRVPGRPLGLIAFYFLQGAPALSIAEAEHLDRVASTLSLGLYAVSESLGASSFAEPAFLRPAAEGAVRWTEQSLELIGSAVARLRSQEDAPPWLAANLIQIENGLLRLKSMRQSVVGVAEGQLPSTTAMPLAELLKEVRIELVEPLNRVGIRFQVDVKPQVGPVRAEPFLLRGMIYCLVSQCRRRLSGIASGGLISILAQPQGNDVQLCVFDNAAALAPSQDGSPTLLWLFERRLAEGETEIVRSAMEHFGGRWSTETREKVGTMWTFMLRTA